MEYKSRKEILERIKTLKAEQQRLEEESIKLLKEEGGEAVYTIRPAGRHVLTIGEGLIQDRCAALIELVKNSYDADANIVDIIFSKPRNDSLRIVVKDDGHGMSIDDIVHNWLVPSTENKVVNRISPKGRTMQGRKGIGRYAASILGDNFKLETITSDETYTSVELNWSEFNTAEFLDQVDVKLKSHHIEAPSGTSITILGDKEQSLYWNEDNIDHLRKELKRIITPKRADEEEEFKINLVFDCFYNDPRLDITEPVESFPILELFDYRISGKVCRNGTGTLIYECQKDNSQIKESLDFNYGDDTKCGELVFDIRVYDRDGDSIDGLIKRGLIDDKSGEYYKRLEAKRLINLVNGIGVYRNGFRIRPLGDADYDWLMLNKQRILNPSMKIGGDQVSGYVYIQSEELSNLEEKSARDGLKENEAYESLKSVTKAVIIELEQRRYIYRRESGASKKRNKLENQFNDLYDYSKLKHDVNKTLKETGLSDEKVKLVENLIDDEQNKKNEAVDEIRNTVAIYQGQATLGKILTVFMHEGSKPLHYFTSQMPNLEYYNGKFQKTRDAEAANKIVELSSGITNNSRLFVNLFNRLNPLAVRRRKKSKEFSIFSVLSEVFGVFESELRKESIEVVLQCDRETRFFGWEEDFYTIFTNLIDNSIYWIKQTKSPQRQISVNVNMIDEILVLEYRDTGPGISRELINSGVIFEPEFTTKEDGGSGLGLAIAGEAADRNGLVLSAEASDRGAYFIISTKERK